MILQPQNINDMKINRYLSFVLLLLFSSIYAVNLKANEDLPIEEESVANVTISTHPYEISPHFPGGDKALLEFIKNNMCYPKIAKEKRIEGRVIVCFYVETDGSITNPSIAKSANSLLNEEALRIVKKMPKWEPGQIGGKIVRMKCFLPITFRCENSMNDCTYSPLHNYAK